MAKDRVNHPNYDEVYIGRDGSVDIPNIIDGFANLAWGSSRGGLSMRAAGEMSCFFRRGKVVELAVVRERARKALLLPWDWNVRIQRGRDAKRRVPGPPHAPAESPRASRPHRPKGRRGAGVRAGAARARRAGNASQNLGSGEPALGFIRLEQEHGSRPGERGGGQQDRPRRHRRRPGDHEHDPCSTTAGAPESSLSPVRRTCPPTVGRHLRSSRGSG